MVLNDLVKEIYRIYNSTNAENAIPIPTDDELYRDIDKPLHCDNQVRCTFHNEIGLIKKYKVPLKSPWKFQNFEKIRKALNVCKKSIKNHQKCQNLEKKLKLDNILEIFSKQILKKGQHLEKKNLEMSKVWKNLQKCQNFEKMAKFEKIFKNV